MAARAGIVEVVTEILTVYPQAIDHINRKGQNVLHVAIMHRQYKVYDKLKDKDEAKRLVRGIDNHGCTILHRAADTKFYHGGTRPTPALKLQQEFIWFEQVKAQMPPHFIMHINRKGKTADQLFKDMHREQLKAAQHWVKNTSQSCSTVAVLVATVVFTAAYTAPGGFLQTDGRPILLDKPLYSFFTVMDVAGLASSLTSVVVFLSILTSSLEFGDFHHRLPRNLSLGFTFLFFSVTSTMLTFTATILLLVHLQTKWTASLTYAATFLPIGVFALFQFPLYYQYFMAAVKSILDFLRKNLPGNWDFLEIKDD
ncbi:protein ACCELERATED CELL DEATH 6-like isoform X1 [Hibiscus syriacus]|uniref:protein ACCELERATED CELL DEATH 6-like isoform X1 n=1 Tax=Hibiscus syriacus TaxID=106335 RepID=UPI0019207391|nr:protein ACCELERATED CELL DEATH 6-like isoform X1 [Hibiscus syriacus]